jgi:cobalt/nickel transport system permease protein
VITAIAGFMVRYLDVVISELNRRRTAMAARGYEPRWIWQNKALAASAGALFIRSYERGERVYAAMMSRGYTGHMPRLRGQAASAATWAAGLAVPAVAWVIVLLAWTVLR